MESNSLKLNFYFVFSRHIRMKTVVVILADSRSRGLPIFLLERVTEEFEVDPFQTPWTTGCCYVAGGICSLTTKTFEPEKTQVMYGHSGEKIGHLKGLWRSSSSTEMNMGFSGTIRPDWVSLQTSMQHHLSKGKLSHSLYTDQALQEQQNSWNRYSRVSILS